MDVPRKDAGRKRLIRRIVWGSLIVITVPLISWGLKRLKPAAPTVEGATVWRDVVKRGPMRVTIAAFREPWPEETLLVPRYYQAAWRARFGRHAHRAQYGFV
jgi:hypothetical protein